MQVGTTTTGEPGTDAAVEIQKTGTKYTANFTIPRGDKGEPASVEHDNTLTGDGTSGTPLGVADGYVISKPVTQYETPVDEIPYAVSAGRNDMPSSDYGPLIRIKGFDYEDAALFFPHSTPNGINMWLGSRINGAWNQWRQIAFLDELPNTTTLANDIASLSTRVQALEARIKSLETNQ